jgi:hypothetical protein
LVELTNNQFDEVEVRRGSYFGAVPMNFESGRDFHAAATRFMTIRSIRCWVGKHHKNLR